ncbi:bifunctional metallophosphatase/5'-nucleotidase [Sandaracinobacteroides hominis]|uniref:bifunctional metallophosphatase/5'-nucleotidase n=1 Tax=Sandaracinobacteroides hominis TaxID=2780086 RepID=UPI0018F785A0|nr:bifunctional metallophosphatase/5'-nucleotidase [Sandaracinobacteroides hominis]
MAKSLNRVRALMLGAGFLAMTACASNPPTRTAAPPPPSTEVRIIAFNDFHGNLLPPGIDIEAPLPDGGSVRIPAGGAAWFADAIRKAKAEGPNTLVVSAGDMVGASPLTSGLFLDEPTIEVMNSIGIDFNAVGNHEFDRGSKELKRLAQGGCEKNGTREPCQLSPNFPGAKFEFLAANSVNPDGSTLFPAVGIRTIGTGAAAVKIGFIGLTLKGTAQIVSSAGLAGVHFTPEAETINALIPGLKAQGVNTIVVLLHEGGVTTSKPLEACAGLSGPIVPILQALDPAVDLVVSGHTHRAYICEVGGAPGRAPVLLTSAGKYGTLLTDIRLKIDPSSGDVVSHSARQVVVQSIGFASSSGRVEPTDAYPRFAADTDVQAIVSRYENASAALVSRVVGKMTAPAVRQPAASGESVMGNLVADAQLAATSAPGRGGAVIALINPGGVRADLVPAADGGITYGQLFASQPFANDLVTMSLTGAELKAVLEQQFGDGKLPHVMSTSASLRYIYDMRRPAGERTSAIRVNGKPLELAATYRVTVNNFLAGGGDGFSSFRAGKDARVGGRDVEALEAYLGKGKPVAPPTADRVTRLDRPAG